MTHKQFTAYRAFYEELYPAVTQKERDRRGQFHNISVFVDAEASVCLENVVSGLDVEESQTLTRYLPH